MRLEAPERGLKSRAELLRSKSAERSGAPFTSVLAEATISRSKVCAGLRGTGPLATVYGSRPSRRGDAYADGRRSAATFTDRRTGSSLTIHREACTFTCASERADSPVASTERQTTDSATGRGCRGVASTGPRSVSAQRPVRGLTRTDVNRRRRSRTDETW
jgi:hypothetical protein